MRNDKSMGRVAFLCFIIKHFLTENGKNYIHHFAHVDLYRVWLYCNELVKKPLVPCLY